MKSIREASAHLDWTHPEPTSRAYDLKDGDEVVATLRIEQGVESATATESSGTWSLKKFGYDSPHVIVRAKSSEADHAKFDSSEDEAGSLRFEDGRQFRWEANLWRGEWSWIDTAADQVVAFKRDFDVTERHEGTVNIFPKGAESPHVAVLVILGWYLIIVAAETSGAAG